MFKMRVVMIFLLAFEAVSIPVFASVWKATALTELNALVKSCVVLPCSFSHPGEKVPTSKMRGIWHLKDPRTDNVYHEDTVSVKDNYKGRTELVGRLGEGNCTLKMTEVKNTDNGPFCFRIEIPTQDKFSFVESCTRLHLLEDPPKPTLHSLKTATQGQTFTITCYVTHTCPSHVPTLTWSRRDENDVVIESHKQNSLGNWEVQSILIFMAAEKDDHTEVICTATFNGGKQSSETLQLFVKRKENHLHIIIPVLAVLGTAVLFGALCFLVSKKYKRQIAELQRNDGDGMWNRLSRMSRRVRSGGNRTSAPPRSNNMRPTTSNQKISKQRCASPKSQVRSCKMDNYKEDVSDLDDDYVNTAEVNVYGNI